MKVNNSIRIQAHLASAVDEDSHCLREELHQEQRQ
jgi:hypothetical protein